VRVHEANGHLAEPGAVVQVDQTVVKDAVQLVAPEALKRIKG